MTLITAISNHNFGSSVWNFASKGTSGVSTPHLQGTGHKNAVQEQPNDEDQMHCHVYIPVKEKMQSIVTHKLNKVLKPVKS